MQFTKMQGAGNDYIYIDATSRDITLSREQITQLSNRHFGIGSDGVVLIRPSTVADFRMEMYNSDGSQSPMCGNAARCIGKYVFDRGLTTLTRVTLETLSGVKTLELHLKGEKVESITVDMGEPVLRASQIPFRTHCDLDDPIVDRQIEVVHRTYRITALSMGNPHAVIFTDKLTEDLVHHAGAAIEVSDYFPQKTNVEFVQPIDRHTLRMRVWERGSGETLACGTGACAALVAGVLNHKTERKATIELLGGTLVVAWDETNNHVYMTGGAEFCFDGNIKL